jgi:flagellar hook-length control protein FliK
MILLETKSVQKSPAPLDLLKGDIKEEKRGFSFLQLLKGFDLPKEQKEQNTPVNETKESSKSIKTALESLLQKSETLQDAQLLHPKLVATIDKSELTALIHKAKEYLKSQIESSPEYKKAQIKELPQTMRGLLEVAKKFGIDITKISVETQGQEREIQALKIPEAANKEHAIAKTSAISVNKENIAQAHEKQRVQETKGELQDLKEHNEHTDKQGKKVEKIETLPLFKVATAQVASTEQFVQIRQIQPNSEQKEQKTKTKETLELLLRGEKVEQTNPKLTADFSVATARVIAPSPLGEEQTQRQNRTLESLLQQGDVQTKEQGVAPLKAESFEVKLNEAKQMIKYLSSDVKQAIEDYKSPFTRVKIQLNPQRLGEIDLTIVQRGKNLHVNMSSNNTAINTLVANVGELRAQLQNSGINNATLNFNNSSEGGNTSGDQGGREQRQEQQRAHQEYEYFARDESNDEIQSSLEIVVPRYI